VVKIPAPVCPSTISQLIIVKTFNKLCLSAQRKVLHIPYESLLAYSLLRFSRFLAQEYNLAQLRPSEIDFLWDQLQDVIEHGKNKDTKTKLKLMQRIYRRLAKTMPKKKSRKRQ
jgi:hypothetical protein